jgi:hypothetical protein
MTFFGVDVRNGVPVGLGSMAAFGRRGFTPASLFAQGEPGAWYDASDLGTMFTTSAGTTPVTAVEQAVGLILDKSRGLAIGPELVTNGDFSNGTTGWGQFAGTIAVSGGEVTLTANAGAAFPQITQTISGLTAGRMYVMTGTARRGTSADPVFISPVSGTSVQTTATTATALRVVFTATGATSNIGLGIFSASANGTAIFDNISVREIAGTHAIQATAASRPVLRARYNRALYSEQYSNAAWATSADVTFSGSVATFAATGYRYQAINTGTAIVGKTYQLSVKLSSPTGKATICLRLTNNGDGADDVKLTVNLTSTPTVYTATRTFTGAGNNIDIGLDNRASIGDGIAGDIVATEWDLRSANDTIYPYQRIEAATVYDSDASKFPLYLACDGSDDSLYTAANLDLSSTDKVTVFAGVTKLSDAAQAAVVELSATVASNNGTFLLAAPDAASATIGWDSKGTAQVDAVASSSVAAPVTAVLTGIGDISGDSAILRVNGAVADTDTGDQGTGNYGTYPLYIGRRNNATLPFNGRIHQLIVRGAASSAAEISSTERYIAGKQGRSL